MSDLRNTGVDAHLLVLDVADTQSVAAAKEKFQEQAGTLDVLINNAGISLGGVPVRVTEETVDDMRAMFEVNTLGPMRVTQAFLPLLRRSKAARIVMVPRTDLGVVEEERAEVGLA